MKRLLNCLLLASVFIYSCNMNKPKLSIEELKQEIVSVEEDFAKMVKEESLKKAFLFYAADSAVLNRNNSILKGKKAIQTYFETQELKEVTLEWTADFIDVAISGDLAYTYGQYFFSAIDAKGENIKGEGVFHTVWKKQPDGNWRFVWD